MRNLFLLAGVFLLLSCSGTVHERLKIEQIRSDEPEAEDGGGPIEPKTWTILVYMAADNNLETEAIIDINEMESVFPQDSPYTILALLDRATGHNGTNGDWTDTRLFEITRDQGGLNGTIVSKQLACPELDLTLDRATELDMGEANTLHSFISFARRMYSAPNSALILWGHGTGWRGIQAGEEVQTDSGTRAVAIDDYSGSFMDLPSLKNALSSFKFDVIGFDTCFGATLETAYEVAPSAAYLVASGGLIHSSGWDYADILTRFNGITAKTPEALTGAIAESFADQYQGDEDYSVSKIVLSQVRPFAAAFCAFTQACAEGITTTAVRDEVFALLKNSVGNEHAPSYPADLFLDTGDLITKLGGYFQSDSSPMDDAGKAALQDRADAALDALRAACPRSYRQGDQVDPLITVFYSVLFDTAALNVTHPGAYIRGVANGGQSSFVKETTGWAPTAEKAGSLLDKLFYWP